MDVGLPTTGCCRATYFARSCYGVPLWAGRIWLPHPFWSVGLQPGGRPQPTIACTSQAVTPADYVELRALEIRKQELEATWPGDEMPGSVNRSPRLWPFRWPMKSDQAETAAAVAAVSPVNNLRVGGLLDTMA